MPRVVVAVNDTSRGRGALRRAREEADLRGAQLEAVSVYPPAKRDLTDSLAQLPVGLPSVAGRAPGPTEPAGRDHRERAIEELTRIVDEELGEGSAADVRLVAIAHETTAEALRQHAEGADMLVVGLRQRSPVGKLVLGSDSRDIILAAPCPVLSVKAPDDES